MYFKSRADAGKILSRKLKHHKKENLAVVALSEGAVIVGAQIAMKLHGNLSLLLTENINLPGEPDAIGSITAVDTFTYNNKYSAGQLEAFNAEYHNYIDEKRREGIHHLNTLLGEGGEIPRERLRHHTVILVSDGLVNGLSLDVAYDYLKRIAIKRLVVATPFATVKAIDRMHIIGDEICCLDVINNFISVNHYYDDATIPPTKDLFRVIKNISLEWAKDRN
ncbi:MAG: phosphoribosyltransferase family protein [Candidatus Saccharibacteria bacterium]|nr:phosphoribosyltransferase family protein [Candidatus Saccharibacteria bacterium]